MGYYDVSLLKADTAFLGRVAASYAQETPLGEGIDPDQFATTHAWDYAAAPGFGDAYASALAGGNPSPGSDPAVITDGMILSATQAIIADETPDPPASDPDTQ